MNDSVDPYECIGICQPDPDTGHCSGCGRPLTPAPVTVETIQHQVSPPKILPSTNDTRTKH